MRVVECHIVDLAVCILVLMTMAGCRATNHLHVSHVENNVALRICKITPLVLYYVRNADTDDEYIEWRLFSAGRQVDNPDGISTDVCLRIVNTSKYDIEVFARDLCVGARDISIMSGDNAWRIKTYGSCYVHDGGRQPLSSVVIKALSAQEVIVSTGLLSSREVSGIVFGDIEAFLNYISLLPREIFVSMDVAYVSRVAGGEQGRRGAGNRLRMSGEDSLRWNGESFVALESSGIAVPTSCLVDYSEHSD